MYSLHPDHKLHYLTQLSEKFVTSHFDLNFCSYQLHKESDFYSFDSGSLLIWSLFHHLMLHVDNKSSYVSAHQSMEMDYLSNLQTKRGNQSYHICDESR